VRKESAKHASGRHVKPLICDNEKDNVDNYVPQQYSLISETADEDDCNLKQLVSTGLHHSLRQTESYNGTYRVII